MFKSICWRPMQLGRRRWDDRDERGRVLDTTSQDQLSELAEVFHLMGDPSRLSILFAVLDGPCPVGAIAEATGLSTSLVSHHLRLLRAGRLVRAERRGKQVFYTVDDEHICSVLTDMADHLAEPDQFDAALPKKADS